MTPKRILLVEDEPGLVVALRHRLESEGYSVESAGDGPSGAALALSGHFDLIILDVMLPGKDGFEVCVELRSRGVQTPVIMLTARGHVTDRVVGLKLGADDYVVKPFEMMELLARVQAQLRRAGVARAPVLGKYRFGAVEVDFDTGQVTRAGHPLDLSARELLMLQHLIQHRGTVVTRDELLNQVWGYDEMPTTRTVDVHVAWLRQKIEPEPHRPRFVITVHGVGYKFVG
jgi:two-component system, OmpR family, alkaline phosphatase synthesis response regulator PhoP